MKFSIIRTNDWPGDDPHCPGTTKEVLTKYGGTVAETYTIELNTMEDLLQLMKQVGHPVIVSGNSCGGFNLPELEIYDDYRELSL